MDLDQGEERRAESGEVLSLQTFLSKHLPATRPAGSPVQSKTKAELGPQELRV